MPKIFEGSTTGSVVYCKYVPCKLDFPLSNCISFIVQFAEKGNCERCSVKWHKEGIKSGNKSRF